MSIQQLSEDRTSQEPEPEEPGTAGLSSQEFWLFRHLPLGLVIPMALIEVAASLISIALDAPWWATMIVCLVVAACGFAPVRGVPIGLRIGAWVHYRWRRRTRTIIEQDSTFDVPLPDGGSAGVRWDGRCLVTMLRVDSPPDTLTLLDRGSLSTDQVLPLTEIAHCLRQFDIALDSIDVVSTGTRTTSTDAVLTGYAAQVAPLGRMYDQILGPLPAIAQRTMWIVLRLDPLANAEAIANRGSGHEGTLRAAIIATLRVANRLATNGIKAAILTSADMSVAIRELSRGIAIDQFDERPDTLEQADVFLTSYQIGDELITADGFARVWAVPSLATTVMVRLLSGDDTRARLGQRRRMIEVDARVRYDTYTEFEEVPLAGLRPLPRRQLWALADSLPIGSRDTGAVGYRGGLDALADLSIPTTGCGQLIGADSSGRGVAIPLVGVGSRRIEIVGNLYLAQQVILRAIALGAGAIVHTDRPAAWHTMVANVGAPNALTLAPRNAGARVTPAGGGPHAPAIVIVFDGVPASAPPGSATVVNIAREFTSVPRPEVDVTIIQDPRSATTITVHTPASKATATLVTTPTEQYYLGA
ncbi:type VII secretion protein EccE [Nocardia rosealba]|uniref:type VII secretion protein EccE n=1 Tax=Nocardia rosealba TaxID=2878563 RepID=UPI001CD99793|nr:type VII secretion protein EccE [Nocardia rosealba]MCA2210229.1 type VII secretion protein EccE [Nocardia rosealba]